MKNNRESKLSRSRTPLSTSSQVGGEDGGKEEEDGSIYQRVDVLGADKIDTHIKIPDGKIIEYSDPTHYNGRHEGWTRTAMNVTNLDADTLEDRIRKASGM